MKKFLIDDSGATAIEYCLIGAALTVMLVFSFPLVTSAVSTRFTDIGPMFTPK